MLLFFDGVMCVTRAVCPETDGATELFGRNYLRYVFGEYFER
jgi:hypothetical protein